MNNKIAITAVITALLVSSSTTTFASGPTSVVPANVGGERKCPQKLNPFLVTDDINSHGWNAPNLYVQTILKKENKTNTYDYCHYTGYLTYKADSLKPAPRMILSRSGDNVICQSTEFSFKYHDAVPSPWKANSITKIDARLSPERVEPRRGLTRCRYSIRIITPIIIKAKSLRANNTVIRNLVNDRNMDPRRMNPHN